LLDSLLQEKMTSRRSSVSQPGSSRRGSTDSDGGFVFPTKLKKGKPVSQVKLTFMGKSMELLVPMNEDVDIYDGESIEGSTKAKSKSNWVELFDMIDLAFNNLTQQNKELKRTVNELSSKVNKILFHEKKETKSEKSPEVKKKPAQETPVEYTQSQVSEMNKKVDTKIQKVEENILQWIDEETKTLKDGLEKDLTNIRSEVDTKNIELNSKVQASITSLKDEVNQKVAKIDDKYTDSLYQNNVSDDSPDEQQPTGKVTKQILDLKNKLHHHCNSLRFLCSEPLSVQFSMWNKKEVTVSRTGSQEVVLFDWVNCNVGGAIDDDGITDIDRVYIPISGPYLVSLGSSDKHQSTGRIIVRRNNRECIMESGRCDIIEFNEDDKLEVVAEPGTKASDINLMGLLIRPRVFITPGTTM